MFSRFFGQRNPEKDIERILVDLQGGGMEQGGGKYFITPDAGHDLTNTVDLIYNPATNYRNGLEMVEAADNVVHGRILVPASAGTSHSGSAKIKTVVSYNGSGDIYCRHGYTGTYCNNTMGHTSGLQSYAAVTLANQSGTWVLCVSEHTISNLDAGDFLTVSFQRDATHASDTYSGGNVWVMGFQIVF